MKPVDAAIIKIMIPREIYKELVTGLSGVVANAQAQALWIMKHRAQIDKTAMLTDAMEIDSAVIEAMRADMRAVCQGRPLTRHYGVAEFWGLPFILNDHTLDPRPDTEIIVETALARFDRDAEIRILDMGTGSGCILIALLHEFKNAKGVGLDLSPHALSAANENAKVNGVSDRCEFMESNWFDALGESFWEQFDLIVSNPPYIESAVIPELDDSVKNHDPILALDGGADGMQAYKIIFSKFLDYLKPDGIGLFEIGFDQCEQILRLGKKSRIRVVRIISDYAGNQRVAELSHENSNGDK